MPTTNFLRLALVIAIILISIENTQAQSVYPELTVQAEKEAYIDDMKVDSEGRIYLAGRIDYYNGIKTTNTDINNIIRLNADQSYDNSFQIPSEISVKNISSIKVYDDFILVFTATNGKYELDILNLDGSLNDQIKFPEELDFFIHGGIWDGSNFFLTAYSQNIAKLYKFDANGDLSDDFTPIQIDGFGNADAITLLNDKIYFYGGHDTYGETSIETIFRINKDGSIDNTFAAGSVGEDWDYIRTIKKHGSFLYVVGSFSTFDGVSTPKGVVRLNLDGSVDESYTPPVSDFFSIVYDVAFDESGNSYYAGYYRDLSYFYRIVSFNEDGTTRDEFNVLDFKSSDLIYVANIEHHKGNLFFSSLFYETEGTDIYSFAAFDAQGSLLPNIPKITRMADITSLDVQADGKVIVSGDFRLINKTLSPLISRLNTDFSFDETFNMSYDFNHYSRNSVSEVFVQPDGKILIGGSIRQEKGETWSITRVNSDGSIDEDFAGNTGRIYTSEAIEKIVQLDNGKIFMAGSTFYSPIGEKNIVLLNQDGTLDETFDAPLLSSNSAKISDFIIEDDGSVIITGMVTNSSYQRPSFLYKLLSDGTVSGNFISSTTLPFEALSLIKTESRIIMGVRNNSGGNPATDEEFVYQFDLNGNLVDDTSIGLLAELAIQPGINFGFASDFITTPDNDIIISGGFKKVNSSDHSGLVKISLDGDLDESFNVNVNGVLNGIKQIDEQNAYVFGSFRDITNKPVAGVAKIKLTNSAPVINGMNESLVIEEDNSLLISKDALKIYDAENELEELILSIKEGDNYTFEGITITPAQDFFGTLTIPVIASDGEDESEPFNIEVTVTPINDAPVIESFEAEFSTEEDTSFDISINQFTVTDVDNNFPVDHTLTLQEGDNYSFDGLTITPAQDFFGTLTIPVMASDGEDDSEPFNVEVTVSPVNDAPVIESFEAEFSTEEDTSFDLSINHFTVTDVDNDFPVDHTLTLQEGDNYSFDGLTITPAQDFYGTLTVPVIANDGEDDSEPFNIVIEVTPVNDAPFIESSEAEFSTEEDTSFDISINQFTITDVDNDFPADHTLAIQEGEDYTFDGLTVTPAQEFFGTLTIPVIASDGEDYSEPFNIELEVLPINDAPILESFEATVSTEEDTSFELSIDQFTATDVDNDFPNDHALVIQEGEDYTFDGLTVTPAQDFFGTLTIPVIASDGEDYSEPFNIELEVLPINDAPILESFEATVSTEEDTSFDLSINHFTVTDVDNVFPADHTLVIQEGENYTFDKLTITPAQDFYGTLTVPVIANDGEDDSEPFNIEIEVLPINDAPILESFEATVSTEEDTSFELSIDQFTATDVDNDFPNDHALVIQEGEDYTFDGLTITPAQDFFGTLAVNVIIQDTNQANSAVFEASVSVTAVNDAPIIEGTTLNTTIDSETSVEITLIDLTVTDVDNDYPTDFTLTVQEGDNYTLNGTTVTPTTDFVGSLAVNISVNDGETNSNTFEIAFTVTEVTSIDLSEVSSKLGLHPNPSTDEITISLENEVYAPVSITMVDRDGKVIYQVNKAKNGLSFEHTIQTSSYPSGLYFIRVVQDQKYRSILKAIIR
ncbi:tandem-95 repeat protein [Roseivirga pacifica]|uniref:tandem-95 repeat protein n=1 Tax=Roseivirga pacifica TaxID=1267423 RepID=UPI003BACD19B